MDQVFVQSVIFIVLVYLIAIYMITTNHINASLQIRTVKQFKIVNSDCNCDAENTIADIELSY